MKRLAIVLSLCMCASGFVYAGVVLPVAPAGTGDDAAYCGVEVAADGVTMTLARCVRNAKDGSCLSEGDACGNGRQVCTTVFSKTRANCRCK